ncbi:hypothetical protein BGZ63DRAFT_486707 [Mariannaea sp. PMI_226]|nr:hypothetical protein BGZ63DRAFT_486707 [Mariannaea sp. PMI_226]
MPPNLNSNGELRRPPGFVSIRDVLDGKVYEKAKVNIAGIIIDVRAPVPTRGADWKCQIRFFDTSVQDDEDASISLNIFRPEKEIPHAGCGDAILLHAVKVQRYRGEEWSLLTTYDTRIHIYQASDIPKPPGNASNAMRPATGPKDGEPNSNDHAFISQLFHAASKDRVPPPEKFETMKMQSANIKEKFSLLKDVVDGQFCDIVAMVVREPYDGGDKISLWVSDFTENAAFFHYTINGANLADGRDGDPFNYTSRFSTVTSGTAWSGPYGKRSMQITCWEPHATAIRQTRLALGSWVSVRNLQIKVGRNAANLEGYLREDEKAYGLNIRICPLDTSGDADMISPQLKEAVRRRRDYERSKKEQLKDITSAAKAGQSRKAETAIDQEPKRKKSRNQKKRHLLSASKEEPSQKKRQLSPPCREEETQRVSVPLSNLNPQVKCENQNKSASLVAEMLEPAFCTTEIDGKTVELQLPFVNLNYRGNVRVVNFRPSKLEEFSYPRKSSEFDILSDNDESDSDSESDNDLMTDFTAVRNWQWRFYLELEDAAVPPHEEKKRVWVAVDNQAAQYLLNLDASNLRHSKEKLEQLRQALSILWGDLEKNAHNEEVKKIRASKEGMPPLDSDDEDGPASKPVSKNEFTAPPFACCIRQYGIKIREKDAAKADAGKGNRWQRVFGLFGTRISVS